ncbi:MAG: bifunctional DNA primase/polymerase [Candidatus Electrothrix aestuarii]|uniref:Bifunctional DNA primase/polymerase n=1 Tax=Candidatus Electrothrix aestuarii TaxID=3062594 RepID=A0AAU8LUL2_9BACT|nr:bifunctional DNA primase/polymerase [Candidatus Electrothrix aestuarii]
MDLKKQAAQLLQMGYEPIPIKPNEKYPTVKNWQNADCAQLVESWPKDYGIGLRTGQKVTAIDIDVYHKGLVDWAVNQFRSLVDGSLLCRVGQPPKTLIPVSCEGVEKKFTSNKWVDQNGTINQIEILSHGQQFVAFGIHPGTGKPYEWDGDLLAHSLPTIRRSDLETVFQGFDNQAAEKGWHNLTQAAETAKEVTATRSRKNSSGDAPGDVYNRSVPLETVLEHCDWTHCQGNYWTRPGKSKGISGAVHGGVLYCFTSSTCLDAEQCHDAFEILSRYEFSGDKSACSLALRQEMEKVC